MITKKLPGHLQLENHCRGNKNHIPYEKLSKIYKTRLIKYITPTVAINKPAIIAEITKNAPIALIQSSILLFYNYLYSLCSIV